MLKFELEKLLDKKVVNKNDIQKLLDKYKDSFDIYAKSELYDDEGKLRLRWVKSNKTINTLHNNYMQYFKELVNTVKPLSKINVKSNIVDKDLITLFPIPDLHLGVLISKNETQHKIDFDLNKGAEWVKESMTNLICQSPLAHTAIIADLGDLLHANDDNNRTKSGNVLNTSNRHYDIFKCTMEVFTDIISKCIVKGYKRILFYSVPGNHSDMAGMYLKCFLKQYFKDNSRVEIVEGNQAQQYFREGKLILGFSHGHQLKPNNSPEVLAYDNKDYFSESEYRYFHFGHFHHNKMFTTPLCDVEIHANLPPRDVWAESMGFRGPIGESKSITYHKNMGEISRIKYNILGK